MRLARNACAGFEYARGPPLSACFRGEDDNDIEAGARHADL